MIKIHVHFSEPVRVGRINGLEEHVAGHLQGLFLGVGPDGSKNGQVAVRQLCKPGGIGGKNFEKGGVCFHEYELGGTLGACGPS